MEAIFIVEIKHAVTKNGSIPQVEHDDHEYVFVLSIDEDVLETPGGIVPSATNIFA